VIETHEHKGDFKDGEILLASTPHFPLKEISNVSAFIGRSPGKQPD
jgi:hypothetical protein